MNATKTLTHPSTPENDSSAQPQHDPMVFTQNMAHAGGEWQRIIQLLASQPLNLNPSREQHEFGMISRTLMDAAQKLASDPAKMMSAQYNLWQDYMELLQQTTSRFFGESSAEEQAKVTDKRFKHAAWQDNAMFDFIKQSYLINSKWLSDVVMKSGAIDAPTAQKADFYTRQIMDAMSPSNFAMTNPEVIDTMLESNGETLVKGLRNLREDLERGEGRLRIRMSDENAFELGKNIATSKGAVVFQNKIMQLIQYAPTTEKAHATPLLLMPAWINKFYIFDLREENSFIRWLTDQGHTVFVISWINPDKQLAHKAFDHYLTQGPLAALDVIETITGTKQTSIIGYCLGGTLLSITLAWLAAKGQSERVASATYLTTMIDFSEPGELGIFIDEEQISAVEERMTEKGYLEAHDMAQTFNMLRANDLIWGFVVNNYLLGKDPFAFDLLYWNADATRMPAAMHSYYLRNMYQKNKLATPSALVIAGEAIDVTRITTPTYILSCREDHIAPWTSTYVSTRLYRGDVTFVLAASGHIAGVINPPAKNKYCYWTRDGKPLPHNAEDWQKNAKENAGSWWPHWNTWQQPFAGKDVASRKVGENKTYPALEAAPGSYVKSKS
jgi:polyhydroxyalkanoate synthase